MSKFIIQIIDDEEEFAKTLCEELNETENFESYYQVHTDLGSINSNINVFLVDLKLKNTTGLNLLEELRLRFPKAQIYIMTGFGTIASAVEAMKLGACDYLTKPITVRTVQNLLLESTKRIETDNSSMSLDRHEREYIEHILVLEKGNISQAAKRLGIHRQSLQRKLKKWVPK